MWSWYQAARDCYLWVNLEQRHTQEIKLQTIYGPIYVTSKHHHKNSCFSGIAFYDGLFLCLQKRFQIFLWANFFLILCALDERFSFLSSSIPHMTWNSIFFQRRTIFQLNSSQQCYFFFGKIFWVAWNLCGWNWYVTATLVADRKRVLTFDNFRLSSRSAHE